MFEFLFFWGSYCLFFIVVAIVFIACTSYNMAIVFAVQKIFFKSFFSKMKAKQVLLAVADITATNLLLYLLMVFGGTIFYFLLQPNQLLVTAIESAIIFAVDFILLRYWEFGSTKQVTGIALALGIFSNPFVVSYAIIFMPPLVLVPALATIAGTIIWAVLFNKYWAEKNVEKKTESGKMTKQEKALSNAGIITLFIFVLLLACGVAIIWGTIVQPRNYNIVCMSSDPAKIMVKANNTPSTTVANTAKDITTIKITNITGGTMTKVNCGMPFTGAFGDANADLGCASEIKSGVEFTVTPDAANTAGTYSTSSFIIFYNDYADFTKYAKITCSGPITVT